MLVANDSNININIEPESVIAQEALFFYGSKGNPYQAITKHSINSMGVIGKGSFLDSDDVFEKLKSLTKTENNTPYINQSIIAQTANKIVFHTIRQKRSMWFRLNGKSLDLMVEWPPLLWVTSKDGGTCHIFALPSNSRPKLTTKVYQAPLMNISPEGYFCQGTARLPKVMTQENIVEAQNSLFDSYFTHVNNSTTIKSKSNVDSAANLKFWINKMKNNSRVLTKELNFHATLESVLGKLI